MNRKIMVFVVGLLALGALEFGLLGASASGIVGGSGNTLPPIVDRGNVPVGTSTPETFIPTFTPTPASAPDPGCAISPPDSSPPCSSLAASIELNQPQPSAIQCDGSSTSLLHVTLRNRFGNVVDDGTPVQFSVFNGSPSPYFALTKNGQAETSIVIYSDSYSYEPNVSVQSGEMETAIRVRCLPNSDCAVSPPPGEPSCAPTPFPCNPSPGADINSPPCAVETPISPPICFPGQTSPPCTPLSPPECDPNVQTTPPCAPPSPPPPPPTGGIGGQIYIGTPELIDGRIRVPVNTTSSQDAFSGFNAHLVFDSGLAEASDPPAVSSAGSVFGSAELFCAKDQYGASVFACITVDGSTTTAGGLLTDFWLTPTPTTGCLLLHLVTYGGNDNGDASSGTFTVNAASPTAQDNTYGPDVYVNTADGTPCTPTPEATPTPPGPDAQTATATARGGIGGPPAATDTPTAVPTSTSVPTSTAVPTRTAVPITTRTPQRTASPTTQRTQTPAAAACADVTGEGRVTGRDVAAIAAHTFGRYRAQYDLNGDHRVNRQDIQIAIRQLGRRC